MKVYDSMEYRRSQMREAKLRKFLNQLDTIGEMLYTNLEYDGVWELIDKFENIRIKYYVEHHEHENVINNKGSIDGKR